MVLLKTPRTKQRQEMIKYRELLNLMINYWISRDQKLTREMQFYVEGLLGESPQGPSGWEGFTNVRIHPIISKINLGRSTASTHACPQQGPSDFCCADAVLGLLSSRDPEGHPVVHEGTKAKCGSSKQAAAQAEPEMLLPQITAGKRTALGRREVAQAKRGER